MATATSSSSTADYDSVTPKKYINTHCIEEVERRAQKLSNPIPGLLRYTPTVNVSPMYVTIRAAEARQQLFKGSLRELQRPIAHDEAMGELARMSRIMLNLHRHGIVHGRLNLSSWREDDNNELFLVDAAIPVTAVPTSAPLLKNIAHLIAPELVTMAGGGDGATKEQLLSPAADAWGLAITFLQLVLSDKQYNSFDRMDVMDADLMCPLVNNLPSEVLSLLFRCLRQDPHSRPSVEEIYCELTGQPNQRQAAVMAAMMGESEDENEGVEEEEEDEEENDDDEGDA